ncbi:SseB family protein [Trueperella sp. LYQ143]|uniref:SseB family protein n=1 Tax=Trueperella sp. LYQ143 TaxID=3391059 RepID=UPI0039831B51
MPDLDRLLQPNPFAGDDGSMPAELGEALAAPEHLRMSAIVSALRRVLVPIDPHPHPGRNTDGSVAAHDRSSSNPLECPPEALIMVDFPGGRRAIPVFSHAAALTRQYPTARPVPVDIAQVAAAAITRSDGVLVLDPGEPEATWIGRSAVMALMTGEVWQAPWDDPHIVERIMAGLGGYVRGLESISIEPGAGGSAVVMLYVIALCDRAQVVSIAEKVSEAMMADPYVRARLDVVEMRPVFAGA